MKDTYKLDELIDKLEKIRKDQEGVLSCPKALYCLCLEIKEIKEMLKNKN